MLNMIVSILSNGQAGLLDIDLLQQQKVLEARAGINPLAEYTTFILNGKPREGQTLEEVQTLLLAEIDKLKKGDFPDWLMTAIIKDLKYSRMKSFENNNARTSVMTNAFVKGIEWTDVVKQIGRLSKITKQQVIDFANANLNNNYAVVYKRQGEDKKVFKVDKPKITAVTLNRKDKSDYVAEFLAETSPRLQPEFLDFKKAITTLPLKNGLTLDYIKNTTNETFNLYYIVEMGKNSDKMLPLAISYLPFLGTNKYTAAQLEQEFYKLGLTFDVSAGEDRVYISLSGLEESFTEGVKLFEHILQNVKGDEKALKNMVADILTKRENSKKDKGTILRSAMASYAKYGKVSPFTDILSADALKALQPDQLVAIIKNITGYQHNIFYYGTHTPKEVAKILNKEHKVPATLKPIVPPKEYPELPTETEKVYFVHFPMVQAEVMSISKGTPTFNKEEQLLTPFYNNYFGSGLSSIVFQEIRESKALAYSAYAQFVSPSKIDHAHYMQTYVGTQADKLKDAIPAMREIVENMPVSEAQIQQSRDAVMKQIESSRTTKASIYWNYRSAQDLGFDYDYRKDIYNKIQKATAADLIKFQTQYVKGRHYTYLVLGDRTKVDMKFLNTIGDVKELKLEEVFGY